MTNVESCSPRKVLVVDDEPLVRQTLSYILQDEFEVVAVGSGEEALEVSERESFPVVILDLCMEGLSGIETLSRLRKLRQDQNVIILTAYETADSAIAALNLGAFNYLTKPFERRHLKEVVQRGFRRYEASLAREEDMRQRLLDVHDRFFSLLCHEFNTPLNIILGFADLLKHAPDSPEAQAWVDHITDSANHLHDILMEIVDYVAVSHSAEIGVEKIFHLRDLVPRLSQALESRNATLEFQAVGEADGPLRGPADAIRAILQKLTRFAAQLSSHVRVSAEIVTYDGPSLRMVVEGTGIQRDTFSGMEIGKLFEPYEYAPFDEGTAMRSSLGLELATCRKIADYAHGVVDVTFDARGELCLVVQVPISLAAAA
jgi:CheY-like chemotaxis protein